jgi:hypothetical protein
MTRSKSARPARLSALQQRQALALLRSGELPDEVAATLGCKERELWRAVLREDHLGEALLAGRRANLERAAQRLASLVPGCLVLLEGGGGRPMNLLWLAGPARVTAAFLAQATSVDGAHYGLS